MRGVITVLPVLLLTGKLCVISSYLPESKFYNISVIG
jgi:hypothetical protein